MDDQFSIESWQGLVQSNPVTKPRHYQIREDLEARDVIEEVLDLSGFKGKDAFNLGCALKYLLRVGRKDNIKQDLGKAKDYIMRLLNGL